MNAFREAVKLVYTEACVRYRNSLVHKASKEEQKKAIALCDSIEETWPSVVEELRAEIGEQRINKP